MNALGKTITKYRKKKRLSQGELAELLTKAGIQTSNKSVSHWELGRAEPTVTTFLTICKILNITDPYGEYFGSNPDNFLSELNEEGRIKALEYIELLKQSGRFALPKVTIIPFTRTIKLFDIPASAGTGSFLDGEEYSEIEVGEEVPDSADFGIRVSGDSMEPQFINGQIVWVQQRETLTNGEIGIFFLNGDAYCKKLQDNKDGLFLVSLNKKYDPIKISKDDSFKIFGKVVS